MTFQLQKTRDILKYFLGSRETVEFFRENKNIIFWLKTLLFPCSFTMRPLQSDVCALSFSFFYFSFYFISFFFALSEMATIFNTCLDSVYLSSKWGVNLNQELTPDLNTPLVVRFIQLNCKYIKFLKFSRSIASAPSPGLFPQKILGTGNLGGRGLPYKSDGDARREITSN